MSLIVDINPVPWEILDLVRARILRNRAKKQRRKEKSGELRRMMQVDNGILAKQRWEEPSFILSEPIFRISVNLEWDKDVYSIPATIIGGNEPGFIATEPYSQGLGIPQIVRVDRVNEDYPGLTSYRVFLVPNAHPIFAMGLTTVYVYAVTETLWLEAAQSGTTIDRYNEILAESLIFEGSPGQMGTLEIQLNGSGATLT
jgi:hypothetical protein